MEARSRNVFLAELVEQQQRFGDFLDTECRDMFRRMVSMKETAEVAVVPPRELMSRLRGTQLLVSR